MPQLVLRHNWSTGPSAANYVAVDGHLDQVWLPWMVRFATSGPPVASPKNSGCMQILTDEVTIKSYLEIMPCMFVVIVNLVSLPRPLFSFTHL